MNQNDADVISVVCLILNDNAMVVGEENVRILAELTNVVENKCQQAMLGSLIANLAKSDLKIFALHPNSLQNLNKWLLNIYDQANWKKNNSQDLAFKRKFIRPLAKSLLMYETDSRSRFDNLIRRFEDESPKPAVNSTSNGVDNKLKRKKQPESTSSSLENGVKKSKKISSSTSPSDISTSKRSLITIPAVVSSTGKSKIIPMNRGGFNISTNQSLNSANKVQSNNPAAAAVATSTKHSVAASETPSITENKTKAASTNIKNMSTTSSKKNVSPLTGVLDYQPKTFLKANEDDRKEEDLLDDYDDSKTVQDDDKSYLENIITNVVDVQRPAKPLSNMEAKVISKGHHMEYLKRNHCHVCNRLNAKKCINCMRCTKCVHKVSKCPNDKKFLGDISAMLNSSPTNSNSTEVVSSNARNTEVLGNPMDRGIYNGFKSGEFDAIFSLIENGMSVNYQRTSSDNSTALMAAAHHGREDIVDRLMSLGADPKLVDKYGNAAWKIAKKRNHEKLSKILYASSN